MMIKDFGPRVESVWEGLRSMTKKMLVGAMQINLNAPKPKFAYDIQSDWELSNLLSVLDEQVKVISPNTTNYKEIKQLTETVTKVLESQSESAEVFIQLAERALKKNDFSQIDRLSDALILRFSVGEVCEIVRQTTNPAIKAIGFETLALSATPHLAQLIDDPLYDEIVRIALEQQAYEYENEYARQIVEQFDDSEEVMES